MQHFRLFFSIGLSQEMEELCEDFAQTKSLKHIDWVRPENRHLTLFFIGNFPSEQVPDFINYIESKISKFRSFEMEFESFMYFPPRGARMIWARFHKSPCFEAFSRQLCELTELFCAGNKCAADIKPKHEVIPHITLARLKGREMPLIRIPDDYNKTLIMNIDAFSLVRSILSSDGAKYNVLKHYYAQDY